MGKSVDIDRVAGIEYHGNGYTQSSIDAIVHILNAGEQIKSARLLSWFDGDLGEHSFLLEILPARKVLIKPGFMSGYSGEGPRGLSTALQILRLHRVEIEEYEIDRATKQRVAAGCLLSSDLEKLERSCPIRPTKLYEYLLTGPCYPQEAEIRDVQRQFPVAINLGLLDERLVDLAIGFFDNPDAAINGAFRRLEDILRNRAGLFDKSGSQLLKMTFEGNKSLLHWNDLDGGEQAGKSSLFVAVFLAYRNPRAHREFVTRPEDAVREFMLINQLYLLEAAAVERVADFATE